MQAVTCLSAPLAESSEGSSLGPSSDAAQHVQTCGPVGSSTGLALHTRVSCRNQLLHHHDWRRHVLVLPWWPAAVWKHLLSQCLCDSALLCNQHQMGWKVPCLTLWRIIVGLRTLQSSLQLPTTAL